MKTARHASRGSTIRIVRLAVCLAISLAMLWAPRPATAGQTQSNVRLPIVIGMGADPDIATYQGMYYMLYNGDHSGAEVRMRVAASIGGLADANDITVWAPPSSMPDICCHVGWGGYLLPYGGLWYIYMQGDDGNQSHERSFVLESSGASPLGPYTFKNYITGVVGTYGYAASAWFVGSQLYAFQTYNGGIYIAKASNPWTLTIGWTNIAQASSSWEMADTRCIDEGSSLIVHNGVVTDLFSAGGGTRRRITASEPSRLVRASISHRHSRARG